MTAVAACLDWLTQLAEKMSRALGLIGLGILLVFAVATLLDGTLRGLLNRPIDAVRDLGSVVVAVSIACCVPIGLLERSNITIKVLDLCLAQPVARILDAMAAVAVEIVLVFVALEFHWFAQDLAQAGEITLMLAIPKAPFWYTIDAILWVAVFIQAQAVVTEVVYCLRSDWRPHTALDASVIEDAI